MISFFSQELGQLPKNRHLLTNGFFFFHLFLDFPWIFHGGRGSGRQKMWGGVGGAGAPPTNMFGFKSPSGDLKPNRNTTKFSSLESSSLESSSLEQA